MESNIRRQIDPEVDDDAIHFVCFIEATPRYRDSGVTWRDMTTGETYAAVLYRRPVTQARPFVCQCGHEHRSIDAADVCGRRLMRRIIPSMRAR